MKKSLLLCLMLFALAASAQKTKVAVYVTAADGVEEATKQIVGSELVAAIVLNNQYSAVERTSDFLKELSQEHSYQRSGSVDDQQIQKLGKQFGVEQVCVANVMPYQDKFYIQARLLDVETATVLATAREISALNTLESIVSASEKVANKLVGKKQEIAKEYTKELSTVLRSSNEDCIISTIDNTGTATLVTIKFITLSNATISISPNTYIRDRSSDKTYKLTGAVGISTTTIKSVSAGVTQFVLYFEKLSESVQYIDIVEPGEGGWKWENITLRPYGTADYYVFEDNADAKYQSYRRQQAVELEKQQQQREQLEEAATGLAESINDLVNTINSYNITVYNHKKDSYTMHFGKTVLGIVTGNSHATFTISQNLYGTLTATQKNGYMIYPTVLTYNIPKQSSRVNLNVYIR